MSRPRLKRLRMSKVKVLALFSVGSSDSLALHAHGTCRLSTTCCQNTTEALASEEFPKRALLEQAIYFTL